MILVFHIYKWFVCRYFCYKVGIPVPKQLQTCECLTWTHIDFSLLNSVIIFIYLFTYFTFTKLVGCTFIWTQIQCDYWLSFISLSQRHFSAYRHKSQIYYSFYDTWIQITEGKLFNFTNLVTTFSIFITL